MPDLFAPFQTDGYGAGTDVIDHHGACLVDAGRDFTRADGTDHGILVQPCQGGGRRASQFPTDQCGTVLERGEAARIEAPGQLVYGPNPGQDLHGRLHGTACNGENLRIVVRCPQLMSWRVGGPKGDLANCYRRGSV